MTRKSLYVFFILLVMIGCTPRQQYVHHYNITNNAPAFKITDERPESEKVAEVLSLNIMNENYGIFKIGDSQMVPDRIKYLVNYLTTETNNELAGRNIAVNHFEIHNNLQKILKRGATFGAFGLVGGILAGVTDNPDALIDIKLSLTIDNTPYGVHLIRGYRLPKSTGASDDLVAAEIYTAINDATDQIISKL